jgi:hypothetical protein
LAPIGVNHAAGREKRDHARYRPVDANERSIGKKPIQSLDISF